MAGKRLIHSVHVPSGGGAEGEDERVSMSESLCRGLWHVPAFLRDRRQPSEAVYSFLLFGSNSQALRVPQVLVSGSSGRWVKRNVACFSVSSLLKATRKQQQPLRKTQRALQLGTSTPLGDHRQAWPGLVRWQETDMEGPNWGTSAISLAGR